MKILYYIHALHIGGAETLITNYLIALHDCGNDVVLVVNQEEDSYLTDALKNKSIKIIPLNKACSPLQRIVGAVDIKIFGYSRKWKRIFSQEKPDVVHIHTFCDAFEICDIDPKKVFYSFHSEVRRSLSIGSKNNYRKLLKYAQKGMGFTALSRTMAADIKKIMKTNRVVYIPNAVDLTKIRSSRYLREDFLKEYNLPRDSFIVGHVGRFHPIKNHEKLFSVFQRIYHRLPSARLILIGTGSSEEIKQIEFLKEKYNVANVTLMLGVRSDATAMMNVFDAFVLTSKSESFSLVLIEAQAQGVRCVTSNVVPAEVICDNCFALDLNESDEVWANAVLSSERNYSENQIEQFDISRVTRKLVEFYTSAVEDNAKEESFYVL